MDYLVDTIEGRIQVELGRKDFEILVLKQKLSDLQKELEDLKSVLARSEAAMPESNASA